jgi:HlyD family secretion protein
MAIYRKSALERLATPERLDTVFVAAPAGAWVAAAAFVVLIGAALAWGFLGRIPTRVAGQSIVLGDSDEIYTAAAPGGGVIGEILVEPGDRVKTGQIVARIDQPMLIRKIEAETATLRQAEARRAEMSADDAAQRGRREEILSVQKAAVEEQLGLLRERKKVVDRHLTDQQALFSRGFTTRPRLLEVERDANDLNENINGLEQKLLTLTAEELGRQSDWRLKLSDQADAVARQGDLLRTLEVELQENSAVRAPVDGMITETAASVGDVAAPGKPVARIVQESATLDALIFLPPFKGKQIRPGMVVQVEPGVVKREEFGAVVGRVRTISDLPVSRSALIAMLHNERLVDQFMRDGAPIVARAGLESAGDTPSGLKWSGGSGPPFRIEPGSLGRATVTVREQAPITLVAPYLRALVGG